MMRRVAIAFGILTALSFLGCDNAKKAVRETKEGYRMVEEAAAQVAEITALLRTNNFAEAKEIATKVDGMLSTRVFSWSLKILATEEMQGVEAAKALIEQLKSTNGATQQELAALAEIEKYFQSKGKEKTGDLLVLIGAMVIEEKYKLGHGAAGLMIRVRQTYRSAPGLGASATNASAP